jgi:hypothetical protein
MGRFPLSAGLQTGAGCLGGRFLGRFAVAGDGAVAVAVRIGDFVEVDGAPITPLKRPAAGHALPSGSTSHKRPRASRYDFSGFGLRLRSSRSAR